jgi:arylformamidase
MQQRRPAGIDYEVEYNNRARVPEHPQIFERWIGEAAAYRERARREKRAELNLTYGPGARRTVDLFHAGAAAPLAMFIHGGYWRSLDPSVFSHLATGLNIRGVTVAMVGYDLCPQVTIATIVDQMRAACIFLWRRFGRPLTVHGWSAGGHLTAAMLATDWAALDAGLPPRLVPAACAISGVFDLTPLVHTSMQGDLRLDDAQARALSPLFWPAPRGTTFDAVVGGLESPEFLRQSRVIADAWGKAGVATRYAAIAGQNHFTVIEALRDPTSAMVERLVELATAI